MTAVGRSAWARWWPGALAWALWALGMLGLAAVPWMDRLLRQAGRADLVQLTPDTAAPVVALVSGATVGAVLASRRPRHPVGWLLLALALSLTATAAAAQYLTWGLLVRPGALPAARSVALYYPAIGFTALTLIGFLLLLTPTGSLPSPRWRWWARAMAAVPVVLVAVVTLVGGPLDPRYLALGGPFDLRGLGGVLLLAHLAALALTVLAVVVAAGSLVGRFGRARGVERLQLRWVAFAAVLVALAGVVVLASLAIGVPGATNLFSVGLGLCLVVLPLATGAAILRYRLYDLDRIISRTLAWGLLTVLLALGYAALVLGLGRLLPQGSSLVVAGATLAVAALFQPARRRVQAAVDRRFDRRRPHDRGVQCPVAPAGRHGHAGRRVAGGGRPDHAADQRVAVAATFGQRIPESERSGWPVSRRYGRTPFGSAADASFLDRSHHFVKPGFRSS